MRTTFHVVTAFCQLPNKRICYVMLCFSGGFRGGCGRTPLAFFRKIQGLPISKIVRTADSTIIIITDFYLAASSHEIFLRVRGREGMKGLGALQRHQLPHPPCKNPGSATAPLPAEVPRCTFPDSATRSFTQTDAHARKSAVVSVSCRGADG